MPVRPRSGRGGRTIALPSGRSSPQHRANGASLPSKRERNLPGIPIPALNGAMWSIPYEFRCYILVMVFGLAGPLKGSLRYLSTRRGVGWPGDGGGRPFPAYKCPRGDALGGTRYCYPGVSHVRRGSPVRSLPAQHSLQSCFRADCGGRARNLPVLRASRAHSARGFWGVSYLLVCFQLPSSAGSSRFAIHTDLSYGIYLYGWPIQSTIAFFLDRAINPWALSAASLALAAAAAWVSWTFVEKPALALAHRKTSKLATAIERRSAA